MDAPSADAPAAPPPADTCPACGAPVEAGRSACPECGLPFTARAPSPALTVDPTARVATAPPADLKTPGPNQWYSERFRTAAADPSNATVGLAHGPAGSPTAGLFSDLPLEAPPLAAGWLVVVGAWASVLAYVLPWASASGLSYFEAWGLYKPSHLLAFFATVAIALLASLRLRLPPLLRWGLLPVLLGAFEFGLFWEWLGSQSIGPGIWILLAGAVLCVSGGIVVAARLIEPEAPA